jgi:hypothetical protein
VSDSLILRAIGKPPGCKLLRIEVELSGPDSEGFLPASDVSFPAASVPLGARADSIIRRIIVRGDFFALPEEGFEALEARLEGCPLASLAARFDDLAASLGVELIGISGAAVAQLVEEAHRGIPVPTP